ncbi:MAG: M48 family metallopeptidase [Alteromonadaceae bacterium]|nr:M48 family metallopeptidase [Alteromonadaceae bacterium]
MAAPGFFERQANARRNTGLLIVLFLTAVALITLAVCLVGYFVTLGESTQQPFHQWLLSSHGLITGGLVVALIAIGSLVRWIDLAGGGERVARMVKGRLIEPDTHDSGERQLRNIVEEMSIASGVPVPDLYVMDHEPGINAFVAGYDAGEAVMVVTRGALEQLDRPELQGVVAHEFSHILNGDMRINVRLIALLAGILMIGQIGQFLVRAGLYRSAGRRLSGGNRDGRAQAAMGLIGLALLIIGYVGVFFGRLIQAAVSRQREMLADASSVQFTRNPEGIGGALYKIGTIGGYLDATSHASDMNHMCFGEAARMKFTSLLASHPDITKRIDAIQSGLLARLRSRLRDTRPASDLTPKTREPEPVNIGAAISSLTGQTGAGPRPQSVERGNRRLSEKVGTVSRQSEAYAIQWLNQLPATFRNLLYTQTGAVQLCYALLLAQLPAPTKRERLEILPQHPLLGPQRELLEKLTGTLEALGEGARFPVLELAMPALRKLDAEQRKQLAANIWKLVAADKRLSLFELAMTSFLSRHLSPGAGRAVPVKHRSYKSVLPALATVLGVFARAGTDSPQQATALYREAMAGFAPVTADAEIPRISIKELRSALKTLSHLSPLLKPSVLDACGHCIEHDGQVAIREYELMRLVADQLDCPMPPL